MENTLWTSVENGLELYPNLDVWLKFSQQVERDWLRAGMPDVEFDFSTPKGRRFYVTCLIDCLGQNPELFFRYLYIVDIPETWIKAWSHEAKKTDEELLEKIIERTMQKVIFRMQYSPDAQGQDSLNWEG